MLSPVTSRTTVGDTVYEQLRLALMWGHFNPGQLITIDGLAQELGTSHMPVREALRRLSAESGLEITRNGTARVPSTSRERLDDICRARIQIEGYAAELAAGRASPEQIERLQQLLDDHATAAASGRAYDMLHQNQLFHFALYDLAGSEVLSQFIGVLWLQMGPYMRLLTQSIEALPAPGPLPAGRNIHVDILAALRAKDAQTVRMCLCEDIAASQQLLQGLLKEAQATE